MVFSGNALTPCMQDSGGRGLTGDAYFERYAADAERVIALFEVSRTQVIFAGAPLTRADAAGDQFTESRLNPLYRYLAEHRVGVSYTDAGAAVLVDGRFTDTLPCLPFEPCTGGLDATGQGINVVRAPDGVHFCPTGEDAVVGATVACSVWSSGAFRYGSALAVPIIERLELGVAAS